MVRFPKWSKVLNTEIETEKFGHAISITSYNGAKTKALRRIGFSGDEIKLIKR